ncbi:hypothetical protein BD410DRAFT_794146 [Rickenella mellea]|uniref:Pre-rRNA-processing protein TSR2 n=1 Tax=Rickenella mellea TaxID=50990 RepID=A0A4Y7PQM6_9AGAM|nr:hypothetical protein BD410DRAFT_794146 [Rickenella mellea]
MDVDKIVADPSSSTSETAPDATLVVFARGVIARLTLWPALRLAIQESWGGPESAQKQTWMASVIVDAFDSVESTEIPDADYVEDMLLQIMSDEFDASLEDGSGQSVAKDILRLWTQLEESKGEGLVREWEELAQKLKGKKVEHQEEVDGGSDWSDESGSDGEDEDDDATENAPTLIPPKEDKSREPEVDEDGFTLVKGKGRR